MGVRLCQPPLEFRPALSRQPDVQHDATGGVGTRAIEEFLRRSERLHVVTDRTKQVRHRLAHRFVIVDDIDNRLLLSHQRNRTFPNGLCRWPADGRPRLIESKCAKLASETLTCPG